MSSLYWIILISAFVEIISWIGLTEDLNLNELQITKNTSNYNAFIVFNNKNIILDCVDHKKKLSKVRIGQLRD